MKLTTLWATPCALILALSSHVTTATVIAQGNTAYPITDTFLTSVLAKVYDHPTGTFVVSTAPETPTPSGSTFFTLATATRTFGVENPLFKAIAPAAFDSSDITMLALATSRGNTAPNIAFVTQETTANANTVNIISITGSIHASSSTLNDASNGLNMNGSTTFGVTSIAANRSFIYAAVLPNNSVIASPIFGEQGSGIAVVSITQPNANSITLEQVAAIPGDAGIKAIPLNNTTPAVLIEGAVNMNPNSRPSLYPAASPYNTPYQYPLMVWDDQLQRLYIGYDLHTNNIDYVNSGGRSVVTAGITDPDGTLAFFPIAPDSAFVSNDQNNIIGVILTEYCAAHCYPPDCYPADCYFDQYPYCEPEGCYKEEHCVSAYCPELDLSVNRIAVLHASTGPSYLIVNGGNGTRAQTGNLIFALPLVDVGDPTNPIQGTLANVNSALTNGKFTIPALVNADLATHTDPAAMVGAGPFPFDADNALSDLVVVGDTVYASSREPQSTTDEVGIFYSQALFDETGKIIRWTPWTKRSFPYNGFPSYSAQVYFFDVDAVAGDIWAVGGTDQTAVAITEWDTGSSSNSLVAQINNYFASPCKPRGCFSVLDLDQSTRGFNGNTCSRYALFGGVNSVIFAQISKALSSNPYCNSLSNPQKVISNFSLPQNLLVTTLPECGAITVLEYSRQDNNTSGYPDNAPNYFYAGTQNGLYVFADPQQNALDVSNFGNLNVPPFSNGQWWKAPNINGAVIDIKTTGNMLYVMTVNSSPGAPLQSTVYRIPFQPTVNTMFAVSNIIPIAQTSSSPIFNTVLRFVGMQIISTAPDGSTEQLVLATNRGLYQSSRAGGVQNALNQTDANWQLNSNGGTNFYLGIGGMHTSIPVASPSTVWPFNLQDPQALRLFNRGSIYQLSGTHNSGPFNFVPPFFNSIDTANPNFATLPPITYFWSDGARRFFLINPSSKRACAASINNKMMVLPFDTIDWNVNSPQQDISFDPTLSTVQSFNWVQDIGASGITMAGTNRGVVGLE